MPLPLLALLAATLAAPRAKAPGVPEAVGVIEAGVGLPVGAPAPTGLEARNLRGEGVPLDKVFSSGPVLVVFYRGGWCPYCNGQLRDLAGAARRFQARGIRILALSVDTPDHAATTQASWEIPFPVLSDSDLTVHAGFRVVSQVDPDTRARYAASGLDLPAHSGRTDGEVAVPSLFLVQDGRIAWAHADPAYKVRPSPQQVLDALAAAGLP